MDEQAANVFLRMSVLMDRGALHAESVEAGREAGAKFTESFKENIKSLAVGFIAFEGIKEGVEAVVGGASELAEATDRAKVAAENAGLSWGAVEDAMKGAESAGEKLGFTNVQVADTYGLLVTRTGDVGKANLQLAEAEDVARFRHLTLADAADKVNRANQGNARALKDLNIIIPANASEAEKAAAITKYFAAQQGQAAEYAKSLAGQTAIAKAQFADAAAALGAELTPALKTATSFLVDHNKAILATAASVGGLYLAYKGVSVAQALWRFATDSLSGALAKESLAERQAALNSAILADAKAKEAFETARAAAAGSTDAVVLAELAVAEDKASLAAARLATAEEAAATTSTSMAAKIGAGTLAMAGIAIGLGAAFNAAVAFKGGIHGVLPGVNELSKELKDAADSGQQLNMSWATSNANSTIESVNNMTDAVNRLASPRFGDRVSDLTFKIVSLFGAGSGESPERTALVKWFNEVDDHLTQLAEGGHVEEAKRQLEALERGLDPDHVKLLEQLLPKARDAIVGVGDAGKDAAPKLADLSSESLALADAQAALTDHWTQTAKAVSDARDSLASAQDTEVKAQQGIVTAQQAVNKARQEAAQNIRDLRDATESLSAAEGDAADKLEHARRAAAAAARLDPNSLQAHEIQHRLADAQSAYDTALSSSAKNRAALADAERKGIDHADNVVSAMRALHDARVQDQKDVAAVNKARGALDDANKANSHSFDLNTAAGRENAKMAQGIKDAYEKLHPASRTEAADLGAIYTNLGIVNTNMGTFLTQLGVAQQMTPPATGGGTPNTPAPRSDDYYGPTSGAKAPANPGPLRSFWNWWMSNDPFTRHASGGDLTEGLNLIGEQGPEWAVKSGPRVQVLPHGQVPASVPANAGGVHLHLTNVTVNEPVDIDMILQKLQFAAKRWG